MPRATIEWGLLAKHLKDRLQLRELSIRAAATEIGCSPATLTRLLQGSDAENTPDTDVFLKAVSWLGRRVSDFEKGSVPSESSITEVEVHLRALPGLKEPDKEALVAMVRTLHAQYRLLAKKG